MIPLKWKKFSELEDFAEVVLPSLKLSQCLDKLNKVNTSARRANGLKDQEEEFIFLHRYFIILNKAKEHPEFTRRSYKNDFELASSNLKRYEWLRNSLQTRYNEKENNEQNSKKSALPVHPYPQEKSLKDLTNTKTAGKDKKNSILPEDVFRLCNSKVNTKETYIIIDARSSEDFNASCLIHPNVINIPEELIYKGITASTISKSLTVPEVKQQWEKRTMVNKLIIFDWNSTEKKPGLKLSYLKEAMVKWDPSNEYKCLPLILEGGYEDILYKYPHITTNPKVYELMTPRAQSCFTSLDFDYPMQVLEPEIKKKPTPSPAPVTKPEINGGIFVIDRSTKPPLKIEPVDNRTADSVLPEANISEDEKPSKVLITADDKLEVQSDEKEDEPPVTKKEDTVPAPKEEVPTPTAHIPTPDPKSMLDQLRKKKPSEIPITKTPSNNKEGNKGAETTRKIPDKDHSVKRTPEKKSTDGITRIPLKKEDGPSGGGILKRSSSSPNIAQMADEVRVPTFSRDNKPVYAERTDSTYGKTAAGLTGLKNFANNCYMNSILQCLSNTKPLVTQLISLNKNLPINYQSKTKGKVAQEVISAFRNLWSGDVKVYSVKDLKNFLGGLKEIFKGTGHQDSNEFLIILLEYLHDDLNMPATVESRLDGAREETGEKAWGEFLRKNCSIIQQLFYGQHRSTVTCSTCHHSSATFEQFFNLYVPIPSKETCTLIDCLQLYMSGEKISGWKCPKCKDERNATKKFDISRLPPILVIALKRFTNEEDSWLQKKENLVTYPLEGLDMERFTIEGSEQRHTRYNLYAMSTHTGTLRAGHYKAICKNYISEKWFMFDDQSVDPLPAHSVRNIPEVYILFYSAVNPNC